MKQYCILLCMLSLLTKVYSQNTEFTIYENGLMYSSETMTQLSEIVTDLNLQFQSCDLHKVYYAKSQAQAHHIYLKKGRAKQAKKDMENGISYQAFKAKYKGAKIKENQLIIRYETIDDGEAVIEFSSIHPTDYSSDIILPDKPENRRTDLQGTFRYAYYAKDNYKFGDESLEAFYFLSNLEAQPLPTQYARLVQYSNCMIDTSTTLYTDNIQKYRVGNTEIGPAMKAFNTYCEQYPGYPSFPEFEKFKDQDRAEMRYWETVEKYEDQKSAAVKEILTLGFKGKELFQAAIAEALERGGHDDEFERYVLAYDSKANALALKRGRKVYGSCSMDQSPRYHAKDIAVLSAETLNWDVFLRAHLDIMNDRFERASDGNYAWGRRKTYIRELEELQIDVPDLLLGISLRIENPAPHHYFGNIRRLGRAMTESKSVKRIEEDLLRLIADENLDDYNRIIGFYLFCNYIYNLEEGPLSTKNKERLVDAAQKLPPYLAQKASFTN